MIMAYHWEIEHPVTAAHRRRRVAAGRARSVRVRPYAADPMRSSLSRPVSALAVLLACAAAPAAALAADTVVPGNQIVQGFQCVGAPCADGEEMPSLKIYEKSNDTPGIRLLQTGLGGFTPQTWDIAGNEANFFIRDVTNSSRLPFRIRPGAPTSSIDITATGDVSTGSTLQQNIAGLAPVDAIDGDAVLTALRTLPISHYTVAGTTRAMPAGAEFHAAFGLGATDTLASQDVATIALAAAKALDARISTLALTPGPKGDAGSSGPKGAPGTSGAKGDAGAPGAAAPATDLAAATTRIAALERSNKKLAKSLATLQKQVRKLTSSKKAKKPRASAARGAANGR